ncbi:hypothetical protein [Isoalcanivorax beigongshangi]|uniref:Glycosyltransferase n=1 Tax=Isoalcanivorax beigongshangi TaxID=3238810 RepID=A0ABV4AGM4_9GAMM
MLPSIAPSLSVITTTDPVAGQLPLLIASLRQLARSQRWQVELVIVDDLGQWRSSAPPPSAGSELSLVLLSPWQRQGQAAALELGIHASRAPTLLTIDPDLHPCVGELPALLAKLAGPVQMVHGVRPERTDSSALRRCGSRVTNWLVSAIIDVHITDLGSPVTALHRSTLAHLATLPTGCANPRLYLYGLLGDAVVCHRLVRGSPATVPSQYSFFQLVRVMWRLLHDSRIIRRALRTRRQP